ncbi:GMC family oxidoreductase [Verminephrobacter eiseniae]|uniref:GMC family oxidoreductase n=1 Tax=Verminephrobacter eiseniae TaxID=364317 RepID=UPI0010E59A05|nr:GMC family oxidoreductase N-terminal domain-containing protein [Verminephrobacter eiseniae]KAB7615169.1 NAD(P)-binding protein [Verminephrobacter sp. Larva24]MCW5233739.1 alanine-phosphoribitol ligase [Verminephrobacter eiseniae]MCW5294707.1 alanine-phosphoribitol ligase [Verminephrobacter eiseniae]MCW8185521.1 alanine-phosphoribitol ligase [Verminephrobacter eiseniae]MCW8224171.1 alanine-phosphoribitol ligase [Verminephrobacter eiseniae]
MYDYVIVGGGAAGCALAARLSEDASMRVLLLEAGPADTDPYIHMPVGFFKMTDGPLTWGYHTVAAAATQKRRIPFAQGRVLGGGSSINAMVYTRGQPADYDGWERDGCTGWGFHDGVLPYLRRMEDNERLCDPYHGVGGPLGVSDLISVNELTKAFVRAGQEAGMPHNSDFNGAQQEGVGVYQVTQRNGRRCSAAAGYLRQARSRPNLTIRTDCLALRVVIENGRAAGVEFAPRGERASVTMVRARREVIVTAGAIGSPKLLMLSGIGRAQDLERVGVQPVHVLDGVGQNLQDHFDIDIVYELNGPYSLDKYAKKHMMLLAGLEYKLFNKGPVTSNIAEAGAFWYSDGSVPTPDLQFHFLPGAGVESGVPPVPSGSGCTLNSYFLRPRSRGSVTLHSADPADAPQIDPAYIRDPHDLKIAVEGIRQSREIMRQSALRKYLTREHFPGDKVASQAEYEAYAQAYGRTGYHPVGTCKMGIDELSVVDPQLRVHGIEGLRVADSSVMPRIVSSNTNAATLMIAEKAADLIRGLVAQPAREQAGTLGSMRPRKAMAA